MAKTLKKKTVRPQSSTFNSARHALPARMGHKAAHKRLSTEQTKLLLELCSEIEYGLRLQHYKIQLIANIIHKKGPR